MTRQYGRCSFLRALASATITFPIPMVSKQWILRAENSRYIGEKPPPKKDVGGDALQQNVVLVERPQALTRD